MNYAVASGHGNLADDVRAFFIQLGI